MINWLHSKLYRPEKGWDPVPREHARRYADAEWEKLDESCLDKIEEWLGVFEGKRVLDLGGGPGQFSVAMARRGARVTWHDVSRIYQQFAEEKARRAGVSISWSLGYLDEALRLGEGGFDLVFNRICWYYAISDRDFSRVVWRLLKGGGVGYIDSNNASFNHGKMSLSMRLRTRLNEMGGGGGENRASPPATGSHRAFVQSVASREDAS